MLFKRIHRIVLYICYLDAIHTVVQAYRVSQLMWGGGEKCTGVSYLTEYTVFGCTTCIAGLSKVKSSQVYFITSSWDNPCPLQKEKKGNETKIQPVQITVFSS